MSSNIINFGETNSKHNKREYSKGGCRECKRRKIKCDEGKPGCWQCIRLKKDCSYPFVGEKVARVSRKFLLYKGDSSESGEDRKRLLSPEDLKRNVRHSPMIGTPDISYVPDTPGSNSAVQIKPTGSIKTPGKISPVIKAHVDIRDVRAQIGNAKAARKINARKATEMGNTANVRIEGKNHANRHIGMEGDNNGHRNVIELGTENASQSINGSSLVSVESQGNQSGQIYPIAAGRGPESMGAQLQPPKEYRPYDVLNQSDQLLSMQSRFALPASPFPITPQYISPKFNSIESLLNNEHDDQLFQLFNMDDLNLLASDLNNIVSNIMHESNFKFPVDDGARLTTGTHQAQQKGADMIPRNIPFEYIKVTKTHEKLYMEEFYNDFAGIILPFSSYDVESQIYFNPARDIILKCASTEAFLLAAVLAHGAKSSYKKNSLAEDEQAYCKYLSKCLTLLGPALNNQNNLTSNIEAVLLTVLLLAAANAANPKQDWRPHLKGAKDLLLKISTRKMKSSKILIFCKFWFVLFEILAGISSKLGGTLKTEEEIENLITPGDEYEVKVLTELGIIVESGFTILGGYHNDSVVHLKDLILILHRIRNNKEYRPKNPFEFLRLLSEFYKLTEIVFINLKCVLSESDFPGGVPQGFLLDTLVINDEKVIISWMDTSHQAYVVASMITLLTVCFGETYELPQVQMLTNRVTNMVSYLSNTTEVPQQTIKCSMMMIQWPMLIAGMNCIKEDSKYLLMKFFRISAQIGSGSAGFALRRVTGIWKNREKGLGGDYDWDDNNDVLSY